MPDVSRRSQRPAYFLTAFLVLLIPRKRIALLVLLSTAVATVLSFSYAHMAAYAQRYDADPSRFGPPAAAAPAGERDGLDAGHHHPPSDDVAATVACL